MFFVIYELVGGFFIINLFVGVVIDTFADTSAKTEGRVLMTEGQQRYVDQLKVLVKTKAPTGLAIPLRAQAMLWGDRGRCCRYTARMTLSKTCEEFILGTICINILTMTLTHWRVSGGWATALNTLNYIFLTIVRSTTHPRMPACYLAHVVKHDTRRVTTHIRIRVLPLIMFRLIITHAFTHLLSLHPLSPFAHLNTSIHPFTHYIDVAATVQCRVRGQDLCPR